MKRMLILLMCSLSFLCFAEEGLEESKIRKFDEYLNEITKAYHIPGMAFILVSPEKTQMVRTYGQCYNPEQQMFLGSMSKSFTALSIMQLVEKNLINLDEDISFYLPDYKFEKKITVRALLNQTSGFDTHAKLHNVKITKSYGKYEYANVNYDLLGKIIEKVSGLCYEDYVQKNIFVPLDMKDSSADSWKVKDSSKLLDGNRNYFGFFKQGEADYPVEKSWFHEPAVYIASTPNDYANYLKMYLNGGITENGKQIISEQSINRMWYENVSYGLDEYDGYYGMGWNYMKWHGQEMVFHGGRVENGITYMFILPKEKLGVCFMLNASDEFVMNSLMDNAIWDSLAIIRGEETCKINHNSYVLLHVLLDFIFVFILSVSVFILFRAVKSKSRGTEKRVLKIICRITGYIIWPLLLLCFIPLFFKTPLWVVRLFVPDLFMVVVSGAVISFAAGIINGIRFIKNNHY